MAQSSREGQAPSGFWDAWFALWAAAGAETELRRNELAGRLAAVRAGGPKLNTLKGWLKDAPAARRLPRSTMDDKLLLVVEELRGLAGANQAARSPRPAVVSWNGAHWRRELSRARHATGDAVANAVDARLVETSTSARELLRLSILPDIDRVAELTSRIGERFADVATPMVILGDGGMGKSVLLRQLYDIASNGNGSEELPILVLCSNIPASADLGTAAAIDAALGLAATWGDGDAQPLTAAVDELTACQPVLILLDTIDLIVNDHTADDVARVLRNLAGRARLMFSCREREYLDLLASERALVRTTYHLPQLGPGDIQRWATAYTVAAAFDEQRRQAFIASLTTPAAATVCATPLRLAMACDIYAALGSIPEDLTVTELYDQYWKQRMAVDRRGRSSAAARSQEATAEAIATEMWNASVRQFAVSVFAAA